MLQKLRRACKMQGTRTLHQGCTVEATPYSTDPLWPDHCAWICPRGFLPLKICTSMVQLRSPAKLSPRPVGHRRRKKRVVIHPNTKGYFSADVFFYTKLLIFRVNALCEVFFKMSGKSVTFLQSRTENICIFLLQT